jgi:hypothetical protein
VLIGRGRGNHTPDPAATVVQPVSEGIRVPYDAKSGGKNGKHCWTGEASSITALSYIPVQLFEHIISRHFRAVPQAMAALQISQFAHLPSTSFLCLLDESPTTLVGSQNLRISLTDGNRYDNLQGKAQNLVLALENINSAAQETDSEDED